MEEDQADKTETQVAKFEILMSFMLKNQVFCDVVLCKLLNGC
jgi:hypothetical protein